MAAVALPVASAADDGAGAAKVEQCGILPGDGAYSYVKVWNVSCGKARKVAGRVSKEFCGPSFQRCSVAVGETIRGRENYRDWKCGLKVGYEFFRVRCEQPGKRFVQESAA